MKGRQDPEASGVSTLLHGLPRRCRAGQLELSSPVSCTLASVRSETLTSVENLLRHQPWAGWWGGGGRAYHACVKWSRDCWTIWGACQVSWRGWAAAAAQDRASSGLIGVGSQQPQPHHLQLRQPAGRPRPMCNLQ